MREMTNEQRAGVAAQAVEAYRVAGEYTDQSPAELLGDLLGDLRHWAAKVGVNFEICDKNARACFENEVREEGDDNGDDLCDQCHSSGVTVDHTDDAGNTVCVRCAREADDTAKECTCDDRSWYGDQHDSACDFAGEDRYDPE